MPKMPNLLNYPQEILHIIFEKSDWNLNIRPQNLYLNYMYQVLRNFSPLRVLLMEEEMNMPGDQELYTGISNSSWLPVNYKPNLLKMGIKDDIFALPWVYIITYNIPNKLNRINEIYHQDQNDEEGASEVIEQFIRQLNDISNNQIVLEVLIIRHPFREDQLPRLLDALNSSPSLRHLSICNSFVEGIEVQDISEFIMKNTTLKSLIIENIISTYKDLKLLGNSLVKNKNLEHIEIDYDSTLDITNEEWNEFISSLKGLKSLILTGYSDVHTRPIAQLLKNNTKLEKLNLRSIHMTDDDLLELSSYLINNFTLRKLVLPFSNRVYLRIISNIFENKSLRKLIIYNVVFSDSESILLFDRIGNNTNLAKIDLINCEYHGFDNNIIIQLIYGAMEKNTKIKLTITNSQFQNEKMKSFDGRLIH